MRWKWTESSSLDEPSVSAGGAVGRDRIRTDLERRGVLPEVSERLSLRIEERALALAPDAYEILLDGVAAASGLRDEGDQEMTQHLRDLNEVERLMGGFSNELAKLDEVLEVLAAHLRRLRASTPSSEVDRTLH